MGIQHDSEYSEYIVKWPQVYLPSITCIVRKIIFLLLLTNFKTHSLSNCQIRNMVLLIFPCLIHFITESLYLLTSFAHFTHPLPLLTLVTISFFPVSMGFAFICLPVYLFFWLCLTICDPMTCSPPGFLVRFSSQEHWCGLPFPSPGLLSYSGIKLRSPALQANSLWFESLGKPYYNIRKVKFFFFSLLDISLKIMPSKGQNFILLWLNNIPLYINSPQLLYPLFYRCTLKLLPNLGYCKCCCNDHGGAYGFLSQCFSFISDKYAEVEFLVNMVILVLILVESHTIFHSDCKICIFTNNTQGTFLHILAPSVIS